MSAAKHWQWPDDYVAVDEGRLRVRPDFLPVFEKLGWMTLEAILSTEQCHVVRRVAERDNCRVDLPDPAGNETVRAYLKRHWSRSPGEWLICRLLGQRWVPPGRAEADAVGACQRAGVATMSVLAAGARAGRWPWQSDSFFLSAEIPAAVPADDFWKDHIGPPESSRVNPHQRRALITALADTARKLHAARLFHRDFYWCHFFVRQTGSDQFETRLIDLQRVVRPRWLGARWRLKDLAQFLFSVPEGYLSREEKERWFQSYRNVPELSWFDRLCYRAIGLRAWLYRRKEARR